MIKFYFNHAPSLAKVALFLEVDARPAAQRVAALREQCVFKTEADDEARRWLFPKNEALKG